MNKLVLSIFHFIIYQEFLQHSDKRMEEIKMALKDKDQVFSPDKSCSCALK